MGGWCGCSAQTTIATGKVLLFCSWRNVNKNYLSRCPGRSGPKSAFLNTRLLLKSIKNQKRETMHFFWKWEVPLRVVRIQTNIAGSPVADASWAKLPLGCPGISSPKRAFLNRGLPLKPMKTQGIRKLVSVCGSEGCCGWSGHRLT